MAGECCRKFRVYMINEDVNMEMLPSENPYSSNTDLSKRRSSKDIARNQNVLTAARVCLALAFVLLIATLVPWVVMKFGKEAYQETHRYCTTDIDARVECTAPGAPNTQQTCWSMGCCWDNSSAIALADFKIPRCFHLTPSEYSYTVSQVDTNPNNDISMKIYPEFSYRVAGVSPTTANVQVQCKDNTHVAISMSKEIIQPSDVSLVSCENILSSSNEGSRFMINITDSYGKPIVAIGGSPMFFAPNYVEFTVFLLSGSSVFGLGQSTRSNHTLDKHWDEIVIFGNAPTIQDIEIPSLVPLSGSYPIYMGIDRQGNAHGFAIETKQIVRATMHPNDQQSITFRTFADQSLRLHVFLGPKPIDIARQMPSVFGFPQLPPFWTLGYHTCRRTNDTDVLPARNITEHIYNAGIPHESDCIDSNIFHWITDELTDQDDVSDFKDYLQNTSRKLVLVHTPHSSNETVLPVISDQEGRMYLGIYQGTPVSYLDVTHPNASSLVATKLQQVYDKFPFDGCLLEANTPVDSTPSAQRNCSATYTFPPVVKSITTSNFANSTICLESLHNEKVPHYYVHNEYGTLHSTVIKDALLKLPAGEKASVIASLSTSLTVNGSRGGYWGGEVPATWSALRQTVVQLGDTALYGIPFTGFPICGFGLNATKEMCRLWTLLGAFYPMAMTYYDSQFEPRDLVSFDEGFIAIAKSAMRLRYSLLSHLDTLMHLAHQRGDPVIRPMYFEFHEDPMALTIEEQFLWGSALMISPVLEPSRRYLQVYFPAGCWYYLHSGIGKCNATGHNDSLPVTDNEAFVHIQGGHVIAKQNASVTTTLTRQNPFTLIAAVATNLNSTGQLILRNDETSEYMSVIFTSSVQHFESICESNCDMIFSNNVSTTANQVYIYGVPSTNQPSDMEVMIDGAAKEAFGNYMYHEDRKVLHIPFQFDMRKHIIISWS